MLSDSTITPTGRVKLIPQYLRSSFIVMYAVFIGIHPTAI
jgi:hypothetical protein